jgi:hypothetical protein
MWMGAWHAGDVPMVVEGMVDTMLLVVCVSVTVGDMDVVGASVIVDEIGISVLVSVSVVGCVVDVMNGHASASMMRLPM